MSQVSDVSRAGALADVGVCTLPRMHPPSAIASRGDTRSPTSVPVDPMSTLSAAMTFPVTVPMITRVFAEISARMSLPVGVVRVIVADLAADGYVEVNRPIDQRSDVTLDRVLIERVLAGLEAL